MVFICVVLCWDCVVCAVMCGLFRAVRLVWCDMILQLYCHAFMLSLRVLVYVGKVCGDYIAAGLLCCDLS